MVILLAGALLILSGCATNPAGIVPLTHEQQAKLLEESRLPRELGIVASKADGTVDLGRLGELPPGTQINIPFSSGQLKYRSVPVVDVIVNGNPTKALVASSLSRSLIDYRRAVRSGVTPIARIRRDPPRVGARECLTIEMITAGGRVSQVLSMARTLQVADQRIYKVPLGILGDQRGLSALAWLAGPDYDVILGSDFLRIFTRITFDFQGGRIFVASGGYHKPDKERLAATLPLSTTFGLPATKALVDGKGPVWAALDTGGDYGLWLPQKLVESLKIEDIAAPASTRHRPGGLPADLFVPAGDRTVMLLGLELTEVPTHVASVSHEGGDPGFALLGRRVLSRYRVTIDYLAQKIYFENP